MGTHTLCGRTLDLAQYFSSSRDSLCKSEGAGEPCRSDAARGCDSEPWRSTLGRQKGPGAQDGRSLGRVGMSEARPGP